MTATAPAKAAARESAVDVVDRELTRLIERLDSEIVPRARRTGDYQYAADMRVCIRLLDDFRDNLEDEVSGYDPSQPVRPEDGCTEPCDRGR